MDPSQKPTNKKSPKANAKIESPFNTKYTKAPMEMQWLVLSLFHNHLPFLL